MGDRETKAVCRTLAIAGVGLLGGSLGMAAKARGLAKRVVGIGRNEGRLKNAVQLGAIDAYTRDLAEGCAKADLIVLCGPVSLILEQLPEVMRAAPDGAVVTDVGSTKNSIVKRAGELQRDGVAFIGSHPIAGSEKSGVEYASADLFRGATVVLTPDHLATDEAIARVQALWRGAGMHIVEMLPTRHDQLLAMVSHLPHLVAASLAEHTRQAPSHAYEQLLDIAGPGFRDTTRIAMGSPAMWEDIFLENADEVMKAMDVFLDVLYEARRALLHRDRDALHEVLSNAVRTRSGFEREGVDMNTGRPS